MKPKPIFCSVGSQGLPTQEVAVTSSQQLDRSGNTFSKRSKVCSMPSSAAKASGGYVTDPGISRVHDFDDVFVKVFGLADQEVRELRARNCHINVYVFKITR